MEIKGKIIVALPEMTGVSKAGNPWKKREYVLETIETYPKKVYFSFFGDRADQYPLAVGDMINLSFDLDSREYNGRWFVSVNAWKAEKEGAGMGAPGMDPMAPPMPAMQGYGAPQQGFAPQQGGFAPPQVNQGTTMPQGSFGGGDQADDLPF